MYKRQALNIVVDLYKRTSDIVMPANIPNFNGIAGSVYMNAGQIENKGIETQVSATPFKGDFSWETTLSWSGGNLDFYTFIFNLSGIHINAA